MYWNFCCYFSVLAVETFCRRVITENSIVSSCVSGLKLDLLSGFVVQSREAFQATSFHVVHVCLHVLRLIQVRSGKVGKCSSTYRSSRKHNYWRRRGLPPYDPMLRSTATTEWLAECLSRSSTNSACEHFKWEETGVLGENPRLLVVFCLTDIRTHDLRGVRRLPWLRHQSRSPEIDRE